MTWLAIYAALSFVGLVLRWWFDRDIPSDDGSDVIRILFWPLVLVFFAIWAVANRVDEWRDDIRARRAPSQGDSK